jgi:hypothetical protein
MVRMRLLLLMCVMSGVLCSLCSGGTINGVLSEERVVRLPNDAAKWYVSVVGAANDIRYQEVLGWFSNVEGLKTLKSQVQFCPVTSDTPIYKERYAPNVTALPTVRVQNDKGVVIYEAAGSGIPMTGEGLYAAIAVAVNGSEELLPWRRHHAHPQPGPTPDPKPDLPSPGPVDPEPQPIDDGGAPVIDMQPEQCVWLLVLLCASALIIGIGVGQWEKLKERWAGKK